MRKLEYTGNSKILLQAVATVNSLIDVLEKTLPMKANFPMEDGQIDYGKKGQLLSSEGEGATSWVDVGGALTDFVTKEDVGQIVLDFLNDGDLSKLLGVKLKNTVAVEETSATSISTEFSPLGGGLVLAVLLHRSKLTEVPDGWQMLTQTESMADGTTANQYVSVFYSRNTQQLLKMRFSQEVKDRLYLNVLSFLGAGTPFVISAAQREETNVVTLCKTASIPVVWVVHRVLWSSGNWLVDGVPEERVVQMPEAGRLLCAFDKSVQKTITIQPSSKTVIKTEFFGIGLPEL